jgi:hypothetical protein
VQTISHPMRLDSAGSLVTVDDASGRAAAELAGHVIACLRGERSLAPAYGVADAAGAGISTSQVAGALAICEPEITAKAVSLSSAGPDRLRVNVDVEWSQQ